MKHLAHLALGGLLTLAFSLPASPALASDDQDSPAERLPSAPQPPPVHPQFFSLAAVGSYARLFDLDIYSVGGAASLAAEGRRVGGGATLRYTQGQTLEGLAVVDAALSGTVDWRIRNWRVGFGGGFTFFSIRRATNQAWLSSVGPESLFRVAYDFGPRPCFFLQVEAEWSLVGALLSNATALVGGDVQVGMRF